MVDREGVPYDRGWSWMIVVGYFCSSFIMVGIAKSYGILMEPLVEEFRIEVLIASLSMAVAGGVYTLTAPVFVALGQHFTERVVVMGGAIFGFCFISLCYFRFSIEYIIIMYGLGAGISNACMFGNGLVMIGKYFKKFRTVANGIALSGASVGTFAVPPLMTFLLESYGLGGTFMILAALYLSVAVSGALYRPVAFYNVDKHPGKVDEKEKLIQEEKNDSTRKKTNLAGNEVGDDVIKWDKEDIKIELEPEEVRLEKFRAYVSSTGSLMMGSIENMAQVVQAEEQQKKNSPHIDIQMCGKTYKIPKLIHFFVLKMPVVQFYTLFSFLVFFGYFNFIIFLPLDALSRGYEKFEKAWFISCAGIGDLVGRICVGILGDLKIVERYKILGVACFCCGLNILMFNFATVFWWCLIHTTLYGLFGGAYVALSSIVLIDMVGLDIMPKALGVILLIQGFGAAIGQPIEGAIRDEFKSYSPLNILNSSMMLIGGLLMFFYPLVRDYSKKKNKKETTKT